MYASLRRSPSSRETLCGCEANPFSYSARYRKSPLRSPVNMRPVRLPPCAAGASPMRTSRAAGSPNPGTGRAQYVHVPNRRTLMRATSSRHATSRGQARHSTMSACSPRRVLRLVHHQRATAEVLPVELRDRLLRLLGVFQVDEGETARATRLAIGHDLDGGHVASFSLHERADLLLGRVERQVSHVEAVAHV